MRGIGELSVVSGLPHPVVDLFWLVTRLGDPWVLLGGLAFLYVLSERLGLDRRRVAFVFATAFVSLGVTLALKSAFALPRPPGALADGYGFPSGHAIGSTVVWGTGALVLGAGQRRLRWLLAGVVVPLVAVSRVVIGVHYLVDVVAGLVVGLAVVGLAVAVGPRWAGIRTDTGFTHRAAERVFAVGVCTALAALLVQSSPDALLTLGAAVGGWGGWRAVEPIVAGRSVPRTGSVVATVGLPVVLGGLLAVEDAAEAATVADPVAVTVAGACVALLFVLPRLAGWVVDDTGPVLGRP